MTDILQSFIDKKKADSDFLSLADGESCVILNLREIKMVTKQGFGGDEKEVLRLVVDVETPIGLRTKKFDNGQHKFATELREKGVTIGCGFTLTRSGQKTQTKYVVSDVVHKAPKPTTQNTPTPNANFTPATPATTAPQKPVAPTAPASPAV